MTNKTLVIYHYYEKDCTYIENFFHFLRFGYSSANHYIVVISGEYSIALPTLTNLTYLFAENKNNDYGGHSFAVKTVANLESYDFFIFINSSVRGPYLPSYVSENWTNCFTQFLKGDVGLVGSAINILPATTLLSNLYQEKYGGHCPFSHVQTMAYGMPKKTLRYLLENEFYDIDRRLAKDEVIRDYEIRLSQEVIAAGWNLKCLLPEYNSIDYRKLHADINRTSDKGDATCSFSYFGRTAHPYETMFVKTNRELFTEQYLNRLAYSLLSNIPPPDELNDNFSYLRYLDKLNLATTATDRIRLVVPKPNLKLIPKPLRPLFLALGKLLN